MADHKMTLRQSLRETAHRLCIALLCVILGGVPAFAGSMTLLGVGGKAATGSPMISPLLSLAGSNSGPSTSAANFAPIVYGRAGGVWTAIESGRQIPFAVPGTLSSLSVNFPAGTGAGTGTYNVALRQNGSTTSLACTTPTTTSAATCTSAGTVTIAAGDLLDWQVTPANTPTLNTFTQIAAVFTSTNSGESFLAVGGSNSAASNAATSYTGFGGTTAFNATEAIVSGLVSTGGVIDQLYVQTNVAPGASPAQYVATLVHNGTLTSLTCFVQGVSTTTCNSPAQSTNTPVTVAAGDTISIQICPGTVSGGTCTPANTPAAGIYRATVRWVPTIPGEMMSFDTMTTAQGTTGTAFDYFNGASNSTDTEANICNVVPIGMTIKKMQVLQSTAPGGATTRTLTLRGGTCISQASVGTPGNLSCTVTSAATTCSDTTNSFGATANSFLDWQVTATGTNAAMTWFKIGSVVTSP